MKDLFHFMLPRGNISRCVAQPCIISSFALQNISFIQENPPISGGFSLFYIIITQHSAG
jgi:hypothetical protein